MINLYTYQDLQSADDKPQFIMQAINNHKSSDLYNTAIIAKNYYDGNNTTITNYFNIIYDMEGKAHEDIFAANHKIASSFFRNAVDQEVSYLLSNGISFGKPDTMDRLGKGFEKKIRDTLKNAEVQGVCFGFWNNDHLEVFPIQKNDGQIGFVPLYDENDGLLKAGIRYWQIDEKKPMRVTLYDLEGITEYIKTSEKPLTEEKRMPYKTKVTKIGNEIVDEEPYENYSKFPIVPMMYNEEQKSALCGKRNTIDALDLATSNMINNVDEANLIYWVLTNCDGMDDMDDRKFIEQLKTTHVVHADGDSGARAEAHTVEAPYVAVDTAIQTLTKRLYTDFQMFDASIVANGNQTATAIRACYVPLDLKTDDTEWQVTDFIKNILELAGIDDKPSYTRNQIVNKTEEIQSLLLQANYLSDEYMIKKLLTINGDIDQYDEIMKQRTADESDRFKPEENIEKNVDEEEEEVIE